MTQTFHTYVFTQENENIYDHTERHSQTFLPAVLKVAYTGKNTNVSEWICVNE
jgi:hypothetical protein